ncbi:MAG: GtrA family protein [Nanohaloarchaea archaeon QH_8_44_6]|nr:MAG: GtrA family protein [Nanohaloarchaea archaeon QH_8_44_6]
MGYQNRIKELLNLERISKFTFIGFIGLLVDNGVIFLLEQNTEMMIEVAKLISAELSIILMFLLNEKWTFNTQKDGLWRFLKSNLVRSGGVIVALVVLKVLYDLFGTPVIIANTAGIIAGFGFNYVFESLYTWKIHRN